MKLGGWILEGFPEEAALELGLEGGVKGAGLRMMTQSEGSGVLCRPEGQSRWLLPLAQHLVHTTLSLPLTPSKIR